MLCTLDLVCHHSKNFYEATDRKSLMFAFMVHFFLLIYRETFYLNLFSLGDTCVKTIHPFEKSFFNFESGEMHIKLAWFEMILWSHIF